VVDPEIRVERKKVFTVLEAVTDAEETRGNWRGVHNGAFDEADRLLYKYPNNVFTGSVHWTNSFQCSKCGEHYFYPGSLEYHAQHCRFQFHQSGAITLGDDARACVFHVTAESPPRERWVCEEVSCWTRRETDWDFPILRRENWRIPQFNSHAFVLTLDGRITSYLVLREKLRPDSAEAIKFAFPFKEGDNGATCDAGWALGEIFTVRSGRGRGYARELLNAALSNLAQNMNRIAYLAPFTDAGRKFVASLGLSNIMLAGG
jgi:GNAT superfamily N-acetyltransferase